MNGSGITSDDIDAYVGQRLTFYRARLNRSRREVAKALGLTVAQIRAFEDGTEHISASQLFEFGELLAIPVAYFYAVLPEPAA